MSPRTWGYLAAIGGTALMLVGSLMAIIATNGHTVTRPEMVAWWLIGWGFIAAVAAPFVFISFPERTTP